MPELPEVETVCWRLREGGHGEVALVGRRVVAVDVVDAGVVKGGVFADVVGSVVVDVRRRAKWITIATDRGRSLVCHLKMTGDLHVVDASTAVTTRFVRWRAALDDGHVLVFTDPRRFGRVDVANDEDVGAFFDGLGPEPLDDEFAAADLGARLRGKRAIKLALLDQSVVAGVGNIYADEALHRAGIDPRVAAGSLDDDAVSALHGALQAVLRESITASRGELAWRYENRDTPSPFRVYERAGLPCLRCATTLSSTTLGSRTTVWCSRCQP